MRKGPAARTLILLAIFFLTLEACARIDDYITEGAPLLSPYNEDTLYTYDALGKRGRPYARYLKWSLNSLGYRGPELNLTASESRALVPQRPSDCTNRQTGNTRAS